MLSRELYAFRSRPDMTIFGIVSIISGPRSFSPLFISTLCRFLEHLFTIWTFLKFFVMILISFHFFILPWNIFSSLLLGNLVCFHFCVVCIKYNYRMIMWCLCNMHARSFSIFLLLYFQLNVLWIYSPPNFPRNFISHPFFLFFFVYDSISCFIVHLKL